MAVALKIQEAADMSASDVRGRLSDAIGDQHRGTGSWANYIDHIGDGESGDVVYSVDSDTKKAPYSTADTPGAASKMMIDFDKAQDVSPRTVYEPEAEEEDHYAAMQEAFKKAELYTELPLYERFISKAERDKADKADFAGKGESFPILAPGDVEAAARSIGRAGGKNLSGGGLKSRIIAIAKRKGWTKYLPKAWQSDDAKESAVSRETGYWDQIFPSALKLTESAETLEVIHVRESKADYEIKLIAPGKGSSAFYPAEVLKRDGPKVFTPGTHVYLNHPTAAEESQRPEGDVANLAGVLTSGAVYHESHAKGPGLYGRMKVFADHAQMVEEKAAHVGMSIRASGIAESGKMRDGVPVLKELTGAESVDVVTRAGAGGMILTEGLRPAMTAAPGAPVLTGGTSGATQIEAARSANPNTGGAADMDAAEVQKLIEAAVKTAQTPLLERALRGDAREAAAGILAGVTLHEAAKALVIETVLRDLPVKDGALDTVKFTESVNAEAKRIGAVIAASTGSGRVMGMGSATVEVVDVAEQARRAQAEKDSEAQSISIFERLGLPADAAKFAAKGRVQ